MYVLGVYVGYCRYLSANQYDDAISTTATPTYRYTATRTPTRTMAPSRALTRLTLLRRAQQAILRRQYHSYDHPAPAGVFNPHERTILAAAYRHVPEHGFTQHALSLGARDAGYLNVSTNLLSEGPFSLIRYHLVTQREALAPRREAMFADAGAGAATTPVPDRVERLTWERLLGNQDVNHQWQEV